MTRLAALMFAATIAVWGLASIPDQSVSNKNLQWSADGNEGLDQLDGVPVFGEIPHLAMAARIKDRVEVDRPHAVEPNGC